MRTTTTGWVLGLILIAAGCGGLVPSSPDSPRILPESSPGTTPPDSAATLEDTMAMAEAAEDSSQFVWEPDSTGVSLQLLMDTDGNGGFDLIWKGDPVYRWDRPSMGAFEVTQRDTSGTWIRTTAGFMAFDITPPDFVYTPPDSSWVDLEKFGRFGRMYGFSLLTWPEEGNVETVLVDSIGLSVFIPAPVFTTRGSLHIKWDEAGRLDYMLLERPQTEGQ